MASNQQDSNNDPSTPKRSERRRIPSQKAREAEEDRQPPPSISSTFKSPTTRVGLRSPTIKHFHQHQSAADHQPSGAASRHPARPPPPRLGTQRHRTRPSLRKDMATKRKRSPSPPRPAVRYTRDGQQLPSFSPDTFLMYSASWPRPVPTSLDSMTQTHRAWKVRMDEKEKAEDHDDGSDDWSSFPDPSFFVGHGGMFDSHNNSIYHSIARVFVNRAKRAFRAGRPWWDFENEELSINPRSEAEAEPDPARRRYLVKTILDPQTRLDVFNAIKVRLCNEIWLEEYVPPNARSTPRDSMAPPGAPEQKARASVEDGNADGERTVEKWLPAEKILDNHILDKYLPERLRKRPSPPAVPVFKKIEGL